MDFYSKKILGFLTENIIKPYIYIRIPYFSIKIPYRTIIKPSHFIKIPYRKTAVVLAISSFLTHAKHIKT